MNITNVANLYEELEMAVRRRRNRSSMTLRSGSSCSCASKSPFYKRNVKTIIISAILVLSGAAFTYFAINEDIVVKHHIHMIETQIAEILNSLPVLRRIANNVQNNVHKCKYSKGIVLICNEIHNLELTLCGRHICEVLALFFGTARGDILPVSLFGYTIENESALIDQVRGVVREELEYQNADKTGKPDYALESAGATIMSTRKTESYYTNRKALSLFGIPLCRSSNGPNAMIQPGVMPGECWVFKGQTGTAIIRLVTKIYVTGVSVEHISRSISPSGETNTAPKEFSIWGLQSLDDKEAFLFGQYTYDTNSSTIQHFPVVHKCLRMFDIIEFKVHSNHGHPEYTCIYRLRVHGELGQN